MRAHRFLAWGLGLFVSIVSAGPAGCGSDPVSQDLPWDAGVDLGVPPGGGVGDPCGPSLPCRPGLACNGGACEPGHSTPPGGPCVISGECAPGHYCEKGVCAPAGTGTDGAPCADHGDCASGFKCVLKGLGGSCAPDGGGDVGDPCTTGADCFSGLACLEGTCGLGVPKPWAGETCDDDPTTLRAYFRVPRGTGDGDFYRLPFPSDIRLKAGRPDLTGHPTPGASLLGYDLVDRWLRAIEQDVEGFGLYPSILFRFSKAPDFATLTGAVHLVDLTLGQPLGLGWFISSGGGRYLCGSWLAIRQGQGVLFTEGHTYAAYLTTAVKGAGGAPIERSTDLAALLSPSPPAEAELLAAYPAFAPLRAYLGAKTIDPASILNATVFTVGAPRALTEKLASAVSAAPEPQASGWVRCDAGVLSPCPDATGERGCGAADPAFDELHALVELPVFQAGTPPYLEPEDGGGLALDAGGAPTVVRTEQVCLALTLPRTSPMPPAGWPTVLHLHGTGGHFRQHVVSGVAKSLSSVDTPGGAVALAALGIDLVQHGPRRGGSSESPENLFYNFANPAAARGNVLQGAADVMSLARLAAVLDVAAGRSPTGAAFRLDPGRLVVWGHSQGATHASVALPYVAGFGAAVLSGHGASLLDALLAKRSPIDVASLVPVVLEEEVGGDGVIVGGMHHPVLNLFQLYMDVADPLAHARLLAQAPPSGIPPRHIFQPYGLGDTFSPPPTLATFALAAGLGLAEHDPSVPPPGDDIGGLTQIPVPVAGNQTVGGTPVTLVVRQYSPPAGKDGHFVAFHVPAAASDVARFLALAATGALPEVGVP